MKTLLSSLAVAVGFLAPAAWVTAIASVAHVGRIPLLDLTCPPCGVVHGVLIWIGVVNW
jgi:hypothetical protein